MLFEPCPPWKPVLHERLSYIIKKNWIKDNDFSMKSCDQPYKLVLDDGEWASIISPKYFLDIPPIQI